MRTYGFVLARALGVCAALALFLAGCQKELAPPRLLLLISVDTLRADKLGAYGSELGLTPNLDRMASESEVFEAMFAPSSVTVPSLSTLFTGLYPESNGVYRNESLLTDGVVTLPEMLAASGWKTGAVVSNYVLRKGTALEQGFDFYDDRFPQLEAVRKLPERTAETTTDHAVEMLDELVETGGEHLFLWVHYQDPHGPYTPPDGYRERYLDEERKRPGGERVVPFSEGFRGLGGIPSYQQLDNRSDAAFYRAGYDGEIRYADEQIGRLLDGVARRGFSKHVWIVFVADHGESLGEDDYWFAHGEYLTDPLVRVPLMIRVPDRPARRREDVAALVDFLPTLLPLVGVPSPSGLPGRNLLAVNAPERSTPAYLATLRGSRLPRIGLVSDGFKYLATVGKGTLSEQLYRLGEEGEDLASQDPERLLRMRMKLAGVRRKWVLARAERKLELSREDRERLEALGYFAQR